MKNIVKKLILCLMLTIMQFMLLNQKITITADNNNNNMLNETELTTLSLKDDSYSLDLDDPDELSEHSVTNEKYIDHGGYFRANPNHAENNRNDNSLGTCTTVALQLFLGYHNYYTDRRLIPTYFWDKENNTVVKKRFLDSVYGEIEGDPLITKENTSFSKQIGTEDTVYKEILNMSILSGLPGIGQLLSTITSATRKFVDEYSDIGEDIVSFNTKEFSESEVKAELDNNRPVVLQMRVNTSSGKSYHTVVAYGYAIVDNEFGFITHFGWKNNSDLRVWVKAKYIWLQTTMTSTHIHNYSNNYTYYQDLYKISTCTTCGYKKVEYLYDFEVKNVDDNEYITIKKVSEQIPNQLTIPETINGTIVKTIDNNAFKDNILLEEITIPSSVTKIGDSVFENCIKLRKVTYLGNDVTVGKYSFKNCDKLSDINLLVKLKQINEGTFEECNSLKTVILSSELTKIDKYAFRNCRGLINVTITNTNSICESAFEGCTNIETISLPNSIETIEKMHLKIVFHLGLLQFPQM